MRRVLVPLATALSLALVLAAGPAQAEGAGYGPGTYSAGPRGGDTNTMTSADPASGKITIFQHNTRQAATVHCIGDGPRATLIAAHTVTGPVSVVEVDYAGATMSEHPVIDVLVTGSSGRWFGHTAAHGPKVDESGTITVPLAETPAPGEVLAVQFGLQVAAGCVGHPTMLGLSGSRPVEGGQAIFPEVRVR